MTLLAPNRTAEASVVDPGCDTEKEVNTTTAATATDLDFLLSTTKDGVTRLSRPSILDRAIVRLSVAGLRWARTLGRSLRTWDELALINRNALAREARETAAPNGELRIL